MTTEQMDWMDDNGTKHEQPATEEDSAPEADGSEEPELRSAFDKENFHEVMLIMQMRLYDLNLALLSALDPDKAQALVEMHAQGMSFAPPPSFMEMPADS